MNEIHSSEDPEIFIKRHGLNSISVNGSFESAEENVDKEDTPCSGVDQIEEIKLMDKIVGKWEQVKTVGMEKFLKQEGGPWIYQKFAALAMPDFTYTKITEK